MARRAATTIVLLTRQTMVRADFTHGARPTLAELWQEPRPDTDDAAALVEMALALGPKPGRSVWVLNADWWVQTLSLPVARTAGLSAADLAGALNFEAEALSGHSALDSVVGHAPVKGESGEKVYWIVQVKTADRERIADVVHQAGARLAGLGHPGGLPGRLVATVGAASWQRVELWPDAVVCLHAAGAGTPQVQVLNIDPQAGRWQNAVEKVRADFGAADHFETVVADGIAVADDNAGQTLVRLEDAASLRKWVTACAGRLAGKADGLPLVRAAARPMSGLRRSILAVGMTLVTLGACSAHYYLWLEPRAVAVRGELQKAQEPAKAQAELDAQIKTLETRRAALQPQVAKVQDNNEAILRQRQRLAVLLKFLAEQRQEDLLIQKIDGTGGEPRVFGLCLRPELADQFATTLGQTLAPQGWEVEVALTQAQHVKADGAPWAFELQFKEKPRGTASLSYPAPAQPLRR